MGCFSAWGSVWPVLVFAVCEASIHFCQAREVRGVLDKRFTDAASWQSLGVTAHKAWLQHRADAASVIDVDAD